MLALATLIFAFVVFQLEMGTECFVGMPCFDSNNKSIALPTHQISHMKAGKRILVNSRGTLSQFEDVFSGIWFIIVTCVYYTHRYIYT
jgi:hypothetical protein